MLIQSRYKCNKEYKSLTHSTTHSLGHPVGFRKTVQCGGRCIS